MVRQIPAKTEALDSNLDFIFYSLDRGNELPGS